MARPIAQAISLEKFCGIDQSMKTVKLFHLEQFAIHGTIYSDTILQNDLNSLDSWASKWQMEFNVSKCKVSKCTRSIFLYGMKRIPLESNEEHSYLGVTLHHGMSWKPLIINVCNKANRLLGFLKRNLHHCSSDLKETAYKHLIIPCLGYCAPIWDFFIII